ncbi:MAG: Stp1/IreP family PP2C-type Ser/Thr phosphatase [Clostridiales bacterium]|nr:Stp1/IreP family PP2C-type Ser/Thr phosphatase [Clostridiales bacterium]
MDVGFKTDKGISRFNNEDACYVMVEKGVFIIADGVGGSSSGEIASRTATRFISQYVENNPINPEWGQEDMHLYFVKCLNRANEMILDMGQRFDENSGMATTIVVAYIDGPLMYVFNLGDSRAYLYRRNELVQITEDHTYVNHLVQRGEITAEEALTHPDRNQITKALGADEHIYPDMFLVTLEADDVIIMCTDGLYVEVPEEEIKGIIEKFEPMSETCSKLIDLANLNGGSDNITVISLKIDKEDINE